MINFASTVGIEARWFDHAPTKPGHLPERAGTVERDGRPRATDDPCPIVGISKDRKAAVEREEKVRALILAGRRNDEAICEELCICKTTLYWTKRRLRERGEIN